jgi:hypothetical protein
MACKSNASGMDLHVPLLAAPTKQLQPALFDEKTVLVAKRHLLRHSIAQRQDRKKDSLGLPAHSWLSWSRETQFVRSTEGKT